MVKKTRMVNILRGVVFFFLPKYYFGLQLNGNGENPGPTWIWGATMKTRQQKPLSPFKFLIIYTFSANCRYRQSLLQCPPPLLLWQPPPHGVFATSSLCLPTRPASTATRRTPNGLPSPMASSCASTAPASTAASASTSASSAPSPWTPGPTPTSRKWRPTPAATTPSTPSSLPAASPRTLIFHWSTTPTPQPSTAKRSKPSPRTAAGLSHRLWKSQW